MDNQTAVLEKRGSATKLSEARKIIAFYLTHPVVRLLAKTRVAPDVISWSGLVLTGGAVALIVTGHLFAAGWVVLLSSFFDTLDGALARHTNQTTRFGAVLDSTLDRLSEAVLLLGILIFSVLNANERPVMMVSLVSVTMVGSFLVSYVRARVEGIGLQCQVGLFTRAERVVVLVLGLLLSRFDYALITALSIIAVLSFITFGQRLFDAWRQTRS
ncbi:MAG: CDP-alcohol phosphatidyltransferase family protein [Chloroflexi bacterium]|nr:CDP-alcohol phosphatidyltransferase family protein [Chloroflexota bacterium]